LSFFAQVAGVYRDTKKPRDIVWNRFVARPLAAVLLVPLAKTSVTPNQVTLFSLVVFLGAMVMLALGHGRGDLIGAVAILELSYVLDCMDGQLARLKHQVSPAGAHLDFLMDELKAFLLVAAVGIRMWQSDGHEFWLIEALLGLVVVAGAISLTTFMRRPEYLVAVGAPPPRSAGDYGDGLAPDEPAPRRAPLALVEDLGRFLIHYPSYLLLIAITDQLDLFLHVYLLTNAAYAGRSLLTVAFKLGRR
jgi:phosphatidylglycerophosphate synthase